MIGAVLLAGCLRGDRAVRVQVVNTCDQDVIVRMVYHQAGLATAQAVREEVAASGTGVLEAIYPGPRTELFFAVSRAADDQPRITLLPQHADRNDALRLSLAGRLCSDLGTK